MVKPRDRITITQLVGHSSDNPYSHLSALCFAIFLSLPLCPFSTYSLSLSFSGSSFFHTQTLKLKCDAQTPNSIRDIAALRSCTTSFARDLASASSATRTRWCTRRAMSLSSRVAFRALLMILLSWTVFRESIQYLDSQATLSHSGATFRGSGLCFWATG